MRHFRISQSGFTLLEVLVALAVLAIALAGLIKGMSGNAANTAYLRDRTFSQWVALNVVAEQQLSLEQSQATGSETMGGHEWYWEYVLKDTFDEEIKRLEVKVSADNKPGSEAVTKIVAFIPRSTAQVEQ